MTKLRVVKVYEGAYDVYEGPVRLGQVRKYETRYNLRRVCVVRGWKAYDWRGRLIDKLSFGGRFELRRDAIEAVQQTHQQENVIA